MDAGLRREAVRARHARPLARRPAPPAQNAPSGAGQRTAPAQRARPRAPGRRGRRTDDRRRDLRPTDARKPGRRSTAADRRDRRRRDADRRDRPGTDAYARAPPTFRQLWRHLRRPGVERRRRIRRDGATYERYGCRWRTATDDTRMVCCASVARRDCEVPREKPCRSARGHPRLPFGTTSSLKRRGARRSRRWSASDDLIATVDEGGVPEGPRHLRRSALLPSPPPRNAARSCIRSGAVLRASTLLRAPRTPVDERGTATSRRGSDSRPVNCGRAPVAGLIPVHGAGARSSRAWRAVRDCRPRGVIVVAIVARVHAGPTL